MINYLVKKTLYTVLLLCSILPLLYATTPKSIIIDTDMGFDDWAAVLWLLNQKQVEVKAITVDCYGLARCPKAADNASELVQFSGKKVPVYMGTIPKSENFYPNVLRDFSSQMALPGFIPNKAHSYQKDKTASEAIFEIVTQSKDKPVTIFSIGSAANIAESYLLARKKGLESAFRQGLAMIYKEGGAFSNVEKKPGLLSNNNIQGNLNIPLLFATDNTTAEWNIFAEPYAMQALLNAPKPTLISPY